MNASCRYPAPDDRPGVPRPKHVETEGEKNMENKIEFTIKEFAMKDIADSLIENLDSVEVEDAIKKALQGRKIKIVAEMELGVDIE